MDGFYSDSHWLAVPISRGRTACSWAEDGWIKWVGGYSSWAKGKPRSYNQWKFVRDVRQLELSTMLEF